MEVPVDYFVAEQTVNDSEFQSSLEAKAEVLGVRVAEKLDIIPELENAVEDSTEKEIESQPDTVAGIPVETESGTLVTGGDEYDHEMIREKLDQAEPASSIHGRYPPNLKCKSYQFRSRENKGIVVLEFNDRPE